MTRSDPNLPDPDRSTPERPSQGNPFDTGLPMLRLPAQQRPKRRRNPTRRRRPPVVDTPEPPPSPVMNPDPPRRSGNWEGRSGDWEEWLDPPRSDEPPLEPESDGESSGYPAGEPDIEPSGSDDDAPRVPSIIDRSGGNPGPALRRPARQRDQPRGNRVLAVLIVLGLGVVVVSVVMFVFNGSGERRPAAVTTPSAAPAQGSAARPSTTAAPGDRSSTIATPDCEQRRTGDVISGTDPGGTSDGPSAILAFERAYYVQRSGFAARGVVAADANVPNAEQIQRGINQVPMGTLYCVQVTRAGSDGDEADWEVQLTQQRPGEEPQTFTQIITTRTTGIRTLITAINAG